MRALMAEKAITEFAALAVTLAAERAAGGGCGCRQVTEPTWTAPM